MQFETAHMYFHNGMVLKWPQLQSTKDKVVTTLPNNKKLFDSMVVMCKIGNDLLKILDF